MVAQLGKTCVGSGTVGRVSTNRISVPVVTSRFVTTAKVGVGLFVFGPLVGFSGFGGFGIAGWAVRFAEAAAKMTVRTRRRIMLMDVFMAVFFIRGFEHQKLCKM